MVAIPALRQGRHQNNRAAVCFNMAAQICQRAAHADMIVDKKNSGAYAQRGQSK
jgi:uncharacterized protein (DUF488 family)